MLARAVPVIALVCFAAATPARAADDPLAKLAAELKEAVAASGAASAPVAVAPFDAPPGDERAARLYDAVVRALGKAGVRLVERQGLAAAAGEAANAPLLAAGADGEATVPTTLVTGAVRAAGEAFALEVKLLDLASGKVLASFSARVPTGAAEAGESTIEASSLDVQIRRLADRVARGLATVPGDARYQRFAILPFEEVGEATADKQLGKLVSAELQTLLARDHDLLVIERAQLTRVLDELALGQTGALDADKSVQVGQLLGAQALVLGTVSEAGAQYRVNARVVDAATGELKVAADVSLPAADLVALSSDAVVLRTTSGSVYRAILLPGWGQFYNRQEVKGAAFIGVETLAAGAATFFHLSGVSARKDYEELTGAAPEEFSAAREKAQDRFRMRNYLIFGLVGVHLLGVLDAYLSGVTYDTATVSAGGARF